MKQRLLIAGCCVVAIAVVMLWPMLWPHTMDTRARIPGRPWQIMPNQHVVIIYEVK